MGSAQHGSDGLVCEKNCVTGCMRVYWHWLDGDFTVGLIEARREKRGAESESASGGDGEPCTYRKSLMAVAIQ
jgi:hypothetical protein